MHLDQQMDDKQEEINQKYKEFLKEKTLIDEIIQQFKAEQRKITIEAMVKKQVAQEEIQEFIDSQKIFVIRENERNNAENEAIKAFIVKKDAWKEVNMILDGFNLTCTVNIITKFHFTGTRKNPEIDQGEETRRGPTIRRKIRG